MATTYHQILRQIANRVDALVGGQPPAMELTYKDDPLTVADFDSTIFPFTAVKDALLLAEGKLAGVIASTGNHPDRRYLADVTADIASGGLIPDTGAGGGQIIGIYGSVRDATDSSVCLELTLEEIERRNRNAGSFYVIPVYFYKIDGNRIYHTRANVKIDVCVYNRTTQSAALDADGAMLLPDYLGEALVTGTLAYLIRDDEFTEQARTYAQYFEDTLSSFGRSVSITSKSRPGPTMTDTST